ncbi:MAG: TldD/PmbA family protein [Oscillospiraceae bacterium]|nr:TldD/PmbA family protein [Oscillospiraceae bacterium]
MKYAEFKEAVAAAAKRLGIEEYELYYSTSESSSASIFRHEIKDFSSSLEGGVSFRCLVNGRMGYASTEELSEETAERIVASAMDNASVLETEEQEFLVEGGKVYTVPETEEYDLPAAEELVKKALEAQDVLYAADPMVIDGSETETVNITNSVAIMNSKGLDLKHESKMSILVSAAVVSDGKEMNDSYEIKAGDLRKLDLAAIAGKAVADAKSKLGAGVAPTGSYPVIFAPKAMSSLLATYSGVFSSESARKGLSRLAGKEGEVIASGKVTLVDDPFYKDAAVKIGFDAEGSPTYTKNVIEKGELKTLLYNLKSAAAMGKETTGNASKAGYSSPVGIRPFTMYLAPGEFSEEDLLKKAGSGVYIDFLGGLHAGADPISGDFSLQSAGFMIENGVKTEAVKNFTVAGNFYELLKNIEELSDKVELPGFGGVTSFGSPAVLVNGLSVAGK